MRFDTPSSLLVSLNTTISGVTVTLKYVSAITTDRHAWSLIARLTFQILAVSLRTTRINIQIFYMVLALRLVFCTDFRTDSNFYCIRH